jgi:hypothetical protein
VNMNSIKNSIRKNILALKYFFKDLLSIKIMMLPIHLLTSQQATGSALSDELKQLASLYN